MSRSFRMLAGLLLALSAGGCNTSPRGSEAPPPERDLWYSIRDGELSYGYQRLTVTRLADGNSEYAVSARIMVELLGAPQETVLSARALLAPDLSLLRLEAESEQMSGGARLRSEATGAGFTIERDQGGELRQSTLAPVAGAELVLDLALGDWLHRLGAQPPGTTRRVQMLAAQSGEVEPVVVRLIAREASTSTWSLEYDEHDWVRITVRLDAAGLTTEQIFTVPPMHLTLASREEALRIETRRIPDRELLVFPVDRELPPARRLQRIGVQLAWQDIAPDEFRLTDSRQQLDTLVEEGGRYTAKLSLRRPRERVTDTQLPVAREDFAGTLAGTDLIVPEDEGIAAIAAQVVAGETSARAATTALCRWVSEFIEPAMIAETLSGPQVLERRTGKCSEYTTLFASLARAAGIPTRVVLGQRRFAGADGDTWGGHMWNEVWLGEWVPVDASVNEVGGSTDLLKFVHSDTVMGTQALRWKLTRSLEVSIADFELLPAASGAGLTIGSSGRSHVNADRGFRFEFPADGWTIEDIPTPGAQVLRLHPPADAAFASAQFHLTTFDVPAGMPPRNVLQTRLEHQRGALDDFELLADEAVTVSGAPGHRLRFGGVPHAAGSVPLRISEVLVIHGGSGLLFNLIASESKHEAAVETFEALVASLGFPE